MGMVGCGGAEGCPTFVAHVPPVRHDLLLRRARWVGPPGLNGNVSQVAPPTLCQHVVDELFGGSLPELV
eukprot:10353342-Prorocentrum_lima.AAC.1